MRLFALVLLIGCGGTGSVSDAALPDFAVGSDGGASDDLGGGNARDFAFDPNGNFGSVALFTGSYMVAGKTTVSSSAGAQFTVISGETYLPASPTGTYGPCFGYSGGSAGGVPTVTYQSAGTVTITGGKQPLTLTPDANSMYTPFSNMTSMLWSGGETLTITAASATVPAFSATLIAPAPFQLTAPMPTGGTFTVALDQDLTFTWTGAGSAIVEIELIGTNKGPTLVCQFPGATGSGIIPKAAFAGFSAGTGGTFAGSVITSTTPAVAGWTISVYAAVPFVVNGVYMNTASVTYQ